MRWRRALLAVAAGAALGFAPNAAAQPGAGLVAGGEKVVVDADELRYDRQKNSLRAEGDAFVTKGDSVLGADEVEVDVRSGRMEASGEVVLEMPEARVRASRARLELEDETGVLEDAEVYLPRSRFLLGSARMEKGLGQSYRISGGVLTTCHCGEGRAPDWSIAGEQVELDLGGWGEVHDGVFRVKDVPVLYLPYGFFPLHRERQTGFLFPRFGLSNRRGFQYVQPFYWAIDKSSDATISLDVETSARLGLLGEYRYALAPGAGGVLGATYFNERIAGDRSGEVVDPNLADPHIPENRWSVIGSHQQPGPAGTWFYARPFVVSDNLFLRDMNALTNVPARGLAVSTLRHTTSEVGLLKRGPWGSFQAEARYFQDLIQKQSRVPQPLPRLRLQLRQSLFSGRLRPSLNAEAVYYYRAPLASGPRLDLAPQLAVPYRAGPYGFGDLRVVLRETGYYLVNNALPVFPERDDGTVPTREVARFQHREILEVGGSFQSELLRIYQVNRGPLRKLKHTLEPFVRYRYVPVVNQDDLPLYDYVDRIGARNLLTYGVVTRLLGKFGAPTAATGGAAPGPSRIRELGRAFVQNSYSISRPIVGNDESSLGARFSGVDFGLSLTPVAYAGARGRAVYSVADRRLLFAEVGARLSDPRPLPHRDDLFLPELRPANSLSVFYQFNAGGAVENVNLATTLRVTDWLALNYFGRFDAVVGRFLENWAGFRLISGCDCWVLDLAVIDRANPDELQVRVLFSLVGLGSFGQQPFHTGLGSLAAPAVTPAALSARF